ncbi:hypothetical protein ACFQVD_16530 [Streptosporangium amethystogenes subsp. fukuiense]|uniref:DoxX family membrane protein n=1 Tax=Streptosporangium amethystogenes subsp. fukuiense TaxID=698418 RepID=A0ABW2SZR5_9ACTN
MRLLARPHQLPPRAAAGVIILNSGLSKWSADEETAAGVHGMAAGTYPFLKKIEATRFVKLLSTAEIALGTALLVPAVPSLLAGAGLTAFAGGLLGLYLKTPGMREEGGLRPTQQGLPIVKDLWLLGIGTGLVMEELIYE